MPKNKNKVSNSSKFDESAINQFEQDHQQKKYSLQIVGFIGLLCSFAYISATGCDASKTFIQAILPITELDTIQKKSSLVINYSFIFGIFLLIVVLATIISRIACAPNPIAKADTGLVAVFNRILSNSIEQYIIFTTMFLYFLKNDNFGMNSHHTTLLAFWFISSRILFAIGYTIGYLSNLITLRAAGFALNLNIIIIMVLQMYGVNLMSFLCSLMI